MTATKVNKEYYWVPEKCIYESGGDCLEKQPDDGPACLVADHTFYDALKKERDEYRLELEGYERWDGLPDSPAAKVLAKYPKVTT